MKKWNLNVFGSQALAPSRGTPLQKNQISQGSRSNPVQSDKNQNNEKSESHPPNSICMRKRWDSTFFNEKTKRTGKTGIMVQWVGGFFFFVYTLCSWQKKDLFLSAGWAACQHPGDSGTTFHTRTRSSRSRSRAYGSEHGAADP